MIKLAYCDVDELNLSKGYKAVSDDRKNKISRFKFDKDKKIKLWCLSFADKTVK